MTAAIRHGEPRHDALRPAVFDPADFFVRDYLDVNDAGEIGLSASFKEDLKGYGLLPRWEIMDGPGDITVCDHCGHHGLRYLGIVQQKSTGAIFIFGSSCGQKAMLEDQAELKLITLKQLAAGRAERAKIAEEAGHYLNDNEDVRLFLGGIERGPKGEPQDSFDFVNSMDLAINKYGSLTPKQAAGLRKVIAKRPEYERRQAEIAARPVVEKGPAPIGRVQVVGEIVSVKFHDVGPDGVFKMVVRMDNLSAVWVTIPEALWVEYNAANAEAKSNLTLADFLVGKRTQLTATFEAAQDDPTFAFGKRPTKATLVAS